jgi:pimeloyl-ACP methyl ester carboxylesterase
MERALFPISIFLIMLVGCQTLSSPAPTVTITPTPFVGSARVKLDDITVYFEAHGVGKPLILIHGGFGSADVWVNQVAVFSQQYYVITPDSRGQGRTTDSDAPISYDLMAEDTIRLMDYLGIESAYIVGWSDGGITGIDLAIHHPERVKALVAYGANINPAGYRDDFLAYVRTVTVAEMELKLGSKYLNLMPDPQHFPVMLEKIKTLYLTEPNFTAEELATIKAPTLILDGQNEEVVRIEHTKAIAVAIPNAELVILPNVGHYAITQMPAVWNKAVLDFLKDK